MHGVEGMREEELARVTGRAALSGEMSERYIIPGKDTHTHTPHVQLSCMYVDRFMQHMNEEMSRNVYVYGTAMMLCVCVCVCVCVCGTQDGGVLQDSSERGSVGTHSSHESHPLR